MRNFRRSMVLGAGLIGALAFTADAQSFGATPLHDSRGDGPYYRNDDDRDRVGARRRDNRRNRDAYSQGAYGYSRDTTNPASVIDRVLSNLNRTASRTNTDGHEREHFRRASQQLYEFRQKWAQGNFDRGKLDRAIEDLEHLTNSNQIRGQDRSLLASDLSALRSFRANGGSYSSRPYGSYPDDSYYRNRR